MRKTFLIVSFFLSAVIVYGSDSLHIDLNRKLFVKGDTLDFECSIPNYAQLNLNSATLNVWIEDVQRNHRWKFRYPIVDGEVSASLVISEKIPDGRYAVNFLVQKGYVKVLGQVQDHEKNDTSLIYMMIQKDKKSSYFDKALVQKDGSFRLKSTLFPDSAFFIFSPAKKVKNNYLSIHIETPLDSVFIPLLQQTQFVTIGNSKMLPSKNTDTSHYFFSPSDLTDVNILPDVMVTGKFKSRVQQFDEEYSSGLFKRDDAIIFDGLESNDISRSVNVLQFLQGRVAGLTIAKNAEGQDVAKWRNEVAEIFLDEFRLDPTDHTLVSTSDIAMIKVFRPPAQLSSFSGGAGAIVIYTKKGNYANDGKNKHNFIVKGYTNVDSIWQ